MNDSPGVAGVANPDDLMVTINNREVPVSQAEEVLKQMEHDLKSGYDRTLAQERERLQEDIAAERGKVATLLEKDLAWYDTHPQSQWSFYEPLVNGGKGELPMDTNTATETKKESAVVTALKQEVENLKQNMASLSDNTALIKTEKALEVRDQLLTKREYEYADPDAVTAKMLAHHQKTGNPATKSEIEQFVKQSHDHAAKIVEKNKTPIVLQPSEGTVLPKAGGDHPSGDNNQPGASKIDLGDLSGLINKTKEFFRNT